MQEETLMSKYLTTSFTASKPNSTQLFSEVQKVQAFLLQLIWFTQPSYY